MESKCPGQDSRGISAELVRCPGCGYQIEMFSDEIRRKCPGCRKVAYREHMPSCIDWCQYAEKCVGEQFFNKYRRDKSLLVKEKLLEEIRERFKDDSKKLDRVNEALSAAEKLLEKEKADFHIVLPAVILHEAGGCGRERHEAAKDILLKHGFRKGDIDEICGIIARGDAPEEIETLNSRVYNDAYALAGLKEKIEAEYDRVGLRNDVEKSFLTETGKALAVEVAMPAENNSG